MSDPRLSITPARAFADRRLTLSDLRVLGALGTFTDRNGWCFPGQDTLAERLGLSRQTVSESINRLAKAAFGYVEIRARTSPGRGKVGNAYRVVLDQPDLGAQPMSPPDDNGGPMSPRADIGAIVGPARQRMNAKGKAGGSGGGDEGGQCRLSADIDIERPIESESGSDIESNPHKPENAPPLRGEAPRSAAASAAAGGGGLRTGEDDLKPSTVTTTKRAGRMKPGDGAKAVAAYNERAARLGWTTAVVPLARANETAVRARLREVGLDGWMAQLDMAEKQPFLAGRTSAEFVMCLAWFCGPKNWAKVRDGAYLRMAVTLPPRNSNAKPPASWKPPTKLGAALVHLRDTGAWPGYASLRELDAITEEQRTQFAEPLAKWEAAGRPGRYPDGNGPGL